jgi:fructose-bisphosphate aldolase class 1
MCATSSKASLGVVQLAGGKWETSSTHRLGRLKIHSWHLSFFFLLPFANLEVVVFKESSNISCF